MGAKLTKQDIVFADAYLKEKGIKFTDVRFELIDHLVSEYQNLENPPELATFLRKRVAWCRMVSEQKAKAVHWGYQKDLWKRVLSFFKSPLFYLITAVLGFVCFQVYKNVDAQTFSKILIVTFFGVVVFNLIYYIYIQYRVKFTMKLLSNQYLLNIFGIPHLFISIFSLVKEALSPDALLFTIYTGIAILVNIAALVEATQKKKKIKEEYKFLKQYFV